jgi:protein translocase SecG subunit
MQLLYAILPYTQIGLSVLLAASILLQQTGAGLSETFGGTGGDVGYHTRRGFEKILFNSSIVIGILFVISALLAVMV